MARLFVFILLMICVGCSSKNRHYTTSNAHSHNDYEKPEPFYNAWKNQFGSIEADIFLYDGKLVVAHDSVQMLQQRTLDSLYLQPLRLCIEKNEGHIYADKNRSLQLMIDIKSEADTTLNKLIETLKHYPSLINTYSLIITISGNRPDPSQFNSYPSWIYFDGELQKDYKPDELRRIVMFSDNFDHYSNDKLILKQMIDKAHGLGKKIRFWNAPDAPESWKYFIELGVDYINTDKVDELTRFLN